MYKCVVTSANNVDFTLIWRRSFANPLFAVEYLDLTNDGVKEIAVASLAGLHVLQVRIVPFCFTLWKEIMKLKPVSNVELYMCRIQCK